MARSTGRVLLSTAVRCGRFLGAADWTKSTGRAKRGCKRHLICDGHGIPLAIKLTGANCHDSTQALPLRDDIPPLQRPRGRPRCRPDSVLGDRAYDAESIRRALRTRQIVPRLAMRNTKHGSGLGRWRWVVERTFAWLNQFRRLRVRYERRPDTHLALTVACILICWKFLQAQIPAVRLVRIPSELLNFRQAVSWPVNGTNPSCRLLAHVD